MTITTCIHVLFEATLSHDVEISCLLKMPKMYLLSGYVSILKSCILLSLHDKRIFEFAVLIPLHAPL
jgi:hypothetical protein